MTSLPLPPSASLSNHFSPPRHCSAGHFSGSRISVETECTSQPLLNALIHDVAFANSAMMRSSAPAISQVTMHISSSLVSQYSLHFAQVYLLFTRYVSASQHTETRTNGFGGSPMKQARTSSSLGRFCALGFEDEVLPVSASSWLNRQCSLPSTGCRQPSLERGLVIHLCVH